MQSLRFVLAVLPALLTICMPGIVRGQDFPTKPIRIVTTAPGGSSDVVMRVVAQGLSLGQPMVIDNRGLIGAELVSKAAPDGYTLLVDGASVWISTLLQKMPYDPVKDFSPVMVVAATPNVLVVHVSVPANSVGDLVALAKAKPGALNYASGGTGGTSHLAGELFKAMTGASIVHVPYKGTGPAVGALVAGEVQMLFAGAATVQPHVKSGRIKAIAVGSPKPSALAPGLPTVSASGLPGFESVLLICMFAPARTPSPVVNKVNREIARVLSGPDVIARLANAGLEPFPNSPDEFAVILTADLSKWGRLIKEAGIRAN